MEFEEHEVTSDHNDDDSGPSDNENATAEEAPQPKKVKVNKEQPQMVKKLQIKDKAAQNFADGEMERGNYFLHFVKHIKGMNPENLAEKVIRDGKL